MTPEAKVKKAITAYLTSIGAWYDNPVRNGFCRAGVPDIVVCYRGRFVGLEVKATAAGKPTAYQAREIVAIQKAEGIAAVVCCVEQVMQILQDLQVEMNGGP